MNDTAQYFELHNPEQGHQVMANAIWPKAKEQLQLGRALAVRMGLLEDAKTAEQRGYLHAVVLTEIAFYARPGGMQHSMKTWKEYFREEFLGFEVRTTINPITGKKSRKRYRISTEDLGVRRTAEYIERVIAYAATDLGIVISQPLPAHLRPAARRAAKRGETVDPETGEILEAT